MLRATVAESVMMEISMFVWAAMKLEGGVWKPVTSWWFENEEQCSYHKGCAVGLKQVPCIFLEDTIRQDYEIHA